jgi:hypothetical protein
VVVHWLGLGRHALFQIGHYHIDTSGQSLGLAGLQRMRQPVNLRIAPRLFANRSSAANGAMPTIEISLK